MLALLKICSRCHTPKPLSEFHTRSNSIYTLRPECKLCSRLYINNGYQERLRHEALSTLGGVCVECGFSDPRALQIDHKNGGGGKHLKSVSWSKRYREIIAGDVKKFQVLCANCNWIKRAINKEVRGVE